MHDDVKLSNGVVGGSERIRRGLCQRFRDEIEMALGHCRVAVEMGLDFDEYAEAVITDACRSLVSSYPLRKIDARLDPHVSRILSHRDYALALLLRRGAENAWPMFVQRFGAFVRSLFIRDGLSYDEAQAKLEELIALLSDTSGAHPPICGYRGSVDLNNWLYCYVRSRYPKRRARAPHVVEANHGRDYVLPLVLHEDDLRQHIRSEFQTVWQKMNQQERQLLSNFAHGGLPLDLLDSGGEDTKARLTGLKQVLEKHSALVKTLAQDLRKRVVGHYRGLVSAVVVEEAIIDVITSELIVELTQIVGAVANSKQE